MLEFNEFVYTYRQIDDKYVKPVVKKIEDFLMDLKAETLQLEHVPIGKSKSKSFASAIKSFQNLLMVWINFDQNVGYID